MPAAASPTPELVLAALKRAAVHGGDPRRPVPTWAILAHLDVRRRSRGASRVRAALAELGAAGLVLGERRHSVPVFALTEQGRTALARIRERAPPALPESPQHRAWRHARTIAVHEIDRLRAQLSAGLDDAAALLGAWPPPGSEQWFALADRLRHDAWVLGSASHCLYEWREPDDAAADVDDGPGGRRNVALWSAGGSR
jgi:hypothetical protein